ncbi:MAG: hypothetical protein KGJ93_04515 [Patescibacteria group bacterium]|nr:hypothetical protein [Patescibacteria group bacterium]
MKKIISLISALAMGLSGLAFPLTSALADSQIINFENPPYTLGVINGQDGWTSLGAAGSGCAVYDHAVASSTGVTGFGDQSLRISNAVTSGCFGDQTFAKPLTDAAGETGATAGSFSVGTLQPHFEMQFDIASTMQTYQPGLFVSVSPDRGDGSRMSYVGFSDEPTGIDMIFYDVQGTSNPANFVPTDLGTYSRSVPHTVKLTMDFYDGPSNDVVKVYVDGNLVHTGTSWENYYRYDSEASAEQSPRIVKTVLFRTGGAPAPATLGYGYLFDNLSESSGSIPASTAKVTIDKFIDGHMATAASANNNAFPMTASWSAANIGSGSGSYTLSPVGFNSPNSYEAVTANMTMGADYSTSEDTSGAVVGADCSTGQPYALVGYTTGSTFTEASQATPTLTAPSFSNLTEDKYVIVWNKMCLAAPTPLSPPDGTVTTTAGLTSIDWSDVSDPAGGITYVYQSSHSSALNPDGSFVSPVYTSGPLGASQIATPGTPAGVYYWHVQAKDADGNLSPWSVIWMVTVDNTPTSKDQCKLGGWQNYVHPDGSAFKNQGDCVSFVASGGKAKGNP